VGIETWRSAYRWSGKKDENNGDVDDFMRFDQLGQIDSLFEFVAPSWMRLTADWLILSLFPISKVVMPSFRCAQKHKRLGALTVCGDFPKAVTCSVSISITSATRCAARLKSYFYIFNKSCPQWVYPVK
jgi:hypothetical protein